MGYVVVGMGCLCANVIILFWGMYVKYQKASFGREKIPIYYFSLNSVWKLMSRTVQ